MREKAWQIVVDMKMKPWFEPLGSEILGSEKRNKKWEQTNRYKHRMREKA